MIAQEADPEASVAPAEQNCEPIVMVIVRPTMGVVPSSLSVPEKVVEWPLAMTVGLAVVKLILVSSFVMVNEVDAELAA